MYKRASASVFSSSSKRSLRWRMISCCSLTFCPSPTITERTSSSCLLDFCSSRSRLRICWRKVSL
ncbi:Uncharacterised protein [Vibrio cholerae]|nr:Uncharacterised protein [Vibrio cholerae]